MTATMTNGTTATDSASASTGPAAAFTDVMSTALELVAGKVSQKADDWTKKLNGMAAGEIEDAGEGLTDLADAGIGEGLDGLAEGGDAKQQAAIKGAQAGLQGKNPVWAAIKGAWSGASPKVKAAIVTAVVALVLLLVLSPVLLLVLLITLLVVAIVMKARSPKQ